MLDTVKVLYRGNPDVDLGSGRWTRQVIEDVAGRRESFWYHKGTLRLVYSPMQEVVKAEFSVPKLMMGSNVAECGTGDLKEAVRQVGQAFGVEDDQVLRLDVCENRRVGDVGAYLSELWRRARAIRGRFELRPVIKQHGVETVWWRNGQRQIVAYDKFAECKEEEAKGVCRLEYRMNRKRVLTRELKTTRVVELDDGLIIRVCEKAFKDMPQQATEGSLWDRLRDKYGSSEALKLIGLMTYMDACGDRGWIPRSSYYRMMKQIRGVLEDGTGAVPAEGPGCGCGGADFEEGEGLCGLRH